MENHEVENWLDNQTEFILSHRGLKHPLFDNLDTYVQSTQFLKTAFSQIYHLVLGFPFHIAGAIATSRDEDILNILIRNLYLEIGGDNGELHINLYRKLLRSVGVSTDIPQKNILWKESINLEKNCNDLYRSENMGTKLGSLFAFETMSSPMVAEWDKSLSKVPSLKKEDYIFFTIHIDIEVDHANDIALITKKYSSDPIFKRDFEDASSIIMKGLENFWDRLLIVANFEHDKQSITSSN